MEQSVVMPRAIMLTHKPFKLSDVMLSVIMVSDFMLSVIMLSDVMLSVVAPLWRWIKLMRENEPKKILYHMVSSPKVILICQHINFG